MDSVFPDAAIQSQRHPVLTITGTRGGTLTTYSYTCKLVDVQLVPLAAAQANAPSTVNDATPLLEAPFLCSHGHNFHAYQRQHSSGQVVVARGLEVQSQRGIHSMGLRLF